MSIQASGLAIQCLVGGLAAVVNAEVLSTRGVEAVEWPPLPDKYGFAGAFAGLSGQHLLVAGGANFPDGVMPWDGGRKVWHQEVFALDLHDPFNGWHRIGKLPVANGYGVSIQLPEGVLMIGGGDAESHFSQCRVMTYADKTLAFSDFPSLPAGLANFQGALCKRSVHVVGGTTRPDSLVTSNRHFILNLDAPAPAWREAPPLPGNGIMLGTAASHSGAFYVMGGCALQPGPDGKPKRTYLLECWKFHDGIWTRAADLPRAAVGAASPAWSTANALWIVGGDDGSQVGSDPRTHRGFRSDAMGFSPATGVWDQVAAAPGPLPVTLPGVAVGAAYLLVSGEIRPGVRTPKITRLTLPATSPAHPLPQTP